MRSEVMEDIQTLGELALPHLWKDEIGDVFILTKRMEVYAYSKTVLGCYCWHEKTCFQMQKMRVIFDVRGTDGGITWFKTSKEYLPLILSLGAFKRRPDKEGRWIKTKESILGHKIFPFTDSQRIFIKQLFANQT